MECGDILDLIDRAIEDWTTSGDAMRWSPNGRPEGGWKLLGYVSEPCEMTCTAFSWTEDRVTFLVRLGRGTLYCHL